jgi:hypothetical protein
MPPAFHLQLALAGTRSKGTRFCRGEAVKDQRYYPADEYAKTEVLDEKALADEAAATPRPDDKTEELRQLSVQDIERLLKRNDPTKP